MSKLIYIIDAGDHEINMVVKKKIRPSRLKGQALKFLQELYGPEIYRSGDIISVKLKEEENGKDESR